MQARRRALKALWLACRPLRGPRNLRNFHDASLPQDCKRPQGQHSKRLRGGIADRPSRQTRRTCHQGFFVRLQQRCFSNSIRWRSKSLTPAVCNLPQTARRDWAMSMSWKSKGHSRAGAHCIWKSKSLVQGPSPRTRSLEVQGPRTSSRSMMADATMTGDTVQPTQQQSQIASVVLVEKCDP